MVVIECGYYKNGGDNFLSDPWKKFHCYHSLRCRSSFVCVCEKLATVLFKMCFQ